MTMRFLFLIMGFALMMMAASTPPYFGNPLWAEVPASFRWTIGASQMLYMLAGMIIGAAGVYGRG